MEQLTAGPTSRVLLLAIESADARQRAQLSRAFVTRLRALPQVTFAGNGEAMPGDGDFLLAHRYVLSNATTPQRYSVEGLRAAVDDTLASLSSPAGVLLGRVLERDPTGELEQLAAQLTPADAPQSDDGVWVSRDGNEALLVARLAADGSDLDGQEAALTAIRTAFAQLTAAPAGAAAAAAAGAAPRLLVSGPATFAVSSRETIKSESSRLSMIGSVLAVLLLTLVYRSLPVVALGMLPVVSGALAGVAAVALTFGTVHGLTLGFGVILIGEAIDYAIYFFVQMHGGAGLAHGDWFERYWPTIRLGTLTSVCGFAALLFSGFPGLAQLGLYSSAGLVAAALATRYVLPVLTPASFRVRDIAFIGRPATALAHALGKGVAPRVAVLVLALAALGVLAAHHDRLWNRELAALGPTSRAVQELDARLRADLGASDARALVVVTGAGRDAVLADAERVGAALEPLVDSGAIAGYESPARFLPSAATQRARLAALPAPAELRTRLQSALQGAPLRAARLEPFIADVQAARAQPLLTAQSLAGTSFANVVDSLLLQTGGQWRALLPLRARGSDIASYQLDVAAVQKALDGAGARDAQLLDLKIAADGLYDNYLHETIRLTLFGLAAVLLLLAIALRSPLAAARVLLAPLAAVVCALGLLVACGRELTLLHVVGMLLVVAVGSNYALFYAAPVVRTSALEEQRTSASVLLACLTSLLGFGVLASSSVPVMRALGESVAPGGLLALLFAMALAPRAARAVPGAR